MTVAIYMLNTYGDTRFKKILSNDEKIRLREQALELKITDLQQELEDVKEKLNHVLFKVIERLRCSCSGLLSTSTSATYLRV